MVYANFSIPPCAPLISISPESLFRIQADQYILVACLMVSLHFFSYSPIYGQFPISDIVVLQLCICDWLLAVSDEFKMICYGKQCLSLGIFYMVCISLLSGLSSLSVA